MRPIATDALSSAPTGINPATRWLAIAASPIDAIHPQEEQSGFPPNWHGVIGVLKSADKLAVVAANTQSSGLSGGRENSRIIAAGISSFE